MPQPLEARTFGVSILRDWREVYDYACQPLNFPRWASGLATELRQDGEEWIAQTPEGEVRVRFSPRNDYGVLDHWVRLPSGVEVYIPLRVIANGEGAELMLTLFRQPEMNDADYARDAKWVTRDLRMLKSLLETARGRYKGKDR